MDKEEILKIKNKSLGRARNSMGANESFYDPPVLVSKAFEVDEIDGMTDREIELLMKLADFASDVFY